MNLALGSAGAEIILAREGKPMITAIHVPPAIMADDLDVPVDKRAPYGPRTTELDRRRLRESVKDLAATLQKISGATFEISTAPPTAGKGNLPILIGPYAEERFGGVKKENAYKQGWRMSVTPEGIGLQGESDESASYAIYELLDRLGCRWYLPGDLGEVLPKVSTISLPEADVSDAPHTAYRGIWYADDAFRRRNRLGGFDVLSYHALEGYVTEEQRERHPEWKAIIGGKPHKSRLKWSKPEVADAIADAIIAKLDHQYVPTIPISPDDGAVFDESEDRALDAGDWDPEMNQVSITDRYIVLCNRIAERVTKKYPDVLFGFLAYVQYTRPPVREKLHPNLVPQIAPINYCRAHSFCDPECSSRASIRKIVEGWARVSPRLTYYNYMFHLAEVTAPYPMIRQMSEELPVLYRNNVVFWQPETTSNFEQVLPGMWLSMRMAWNTEIDPAATLEEFYNHFYGAAAAPMRRYWEMFDRAWTELPLHAGGNWSYNRRFTPDFLKSARQVMDEATAAAATPMEYRRVALQERALRQFERFMQMRFDLNEGRLSRMDIQDQEWYGTQLGLSEEYAANFAFSKAGWTRRTVGGEYYQDFMGHTYRAAAEMAKTHIRHGAPLRQWKYTFLADPGTKPGESVRVFDGVAPGLEKKWQEPGFNDRAWKTTDVALDTWSDLGHTTMGTMWYRCSLPKVAFAPGKKVVLWFAATDGKMRVYVNGQAIAYRNEKGEVAEESSSYARPLSFDITNAVKSGEPINIALAVTRFAINELGTGGLIGPVYLFQEK